ncbi:nucleoside-diphosphate kinase [Streptomyces aureoversilis]|uniref:Nucleoside-diphosphate kinase n=1 Tax=Streptomyces aureoversilis TaxID=67277 RepID=A0ABW0A092_9ACTN
MLITPDTHRRNGAGPTERGFLLFKPDALERRLVKDCVADIAQAGLRVLRQRTLRLTEAQIAAVWSGIDPDRRPLTAGLMRRYLSAGPSRLVLVEGTEATTRLLALKSTIRRRHGAVYYANLVHSPDSADEARRELAVLLDGRCDPHALFRPTTATWRGWNMETIEAGLDSWWASVPEQRGRQQTHWNPPLPAAGHPVHIHAKRHWAVAFDDMAGFLAETAGVDDLEFAVRAGFAVLYDRDGFVLPTTSAKAAHETCRAVRAFGLIAYGPGDTGQSDPGAGTAPRSDPRD